MRHFPRDTKSSWLIIGFQFDNKVFCLHFFCPKPLFLHYNKVTFLLLAPPCCSSFCCYFCYCCCLHFHSFITCVKFHVLYLTPGTFLSALGLCCIWEVLFFNRAFQFSSPPFPSGAPLCFHVRVFSPVSSTSYFPWKNSKYRESSAIRHLAPQALPFKYSLQPCSQITWAFGLSPLTWQRICASWQLHDIYKFHVSLWECACVHAKIH